MRICMNSAGMSFDFSGKRVLVTGAGKGIGRGTAEALAKAGATVIAFSRTQTDLDSLKDDVPGVICVRVDVTDLPAVRQAVESLQPIHLLVNNAGVTVLQPFLEVTPDAFDRVVDVNLKAVLFLSQYVAKGMVDRDEGGAIVNVSSVASQVALRDHAVYCSSKAGVDMLTKVMGLELGPHKIRVNAVNPTVVWTDMGKLAWSDPEKSKPLLDRIPLGEFVEVKNVVNTILFLLSEQSAMINCTTTLIDGGLSAT